MMNLPRADRAGLFMSFVGVWSGIAFRVRFFGLYFLVIAFWVRFFGLDFLVIAFRVRF